MPNMPRFNEHCDCCYFCKDAEVMLYNKVSKVINRFFTFFTKNITKIVYPFLENKGKVNRTCN